MINAPRTVRRDTTLIQVLSLYLILLAFFVLLYNSSRVEDARARSVAGSLQATFSETGKKRDQPAPNTSMLADTLAAAQFMQAMAEAVKQEVPVAEIDVVKRGRLLRARLQAMDLFPDGSADLWPGRLDLIERIAAALNDRPSGTRYDLEVLFASPWITPKMLGKKPPLVVARATNIAMAVDRAGAPKGTVSVGVRQGESGWIDLRFHIRSEQEARQTLPLETAGPLDTNGSPITDGEAAP